MLRPRPGSRPKV